MYLNQVFRNALKRYKHASFRFLPKDGAEDHQNLLVPVETKRGRTSNIISKLFPRIFPAKSIHHPGTLRIYRAKVRTYKGWLASRVDGRTKIEMNPVKRRGEDFFILCVMSLSACPPAA